MRYIATVKSVQEIGIHSIAAPGPWSELLGKLGLDPVLTDGKVAVVINTLNTSWMGFRFSEAIIAIDVLARHDGTQTKAVYMDLAFQSLRSFAFIERHRFRTGFYYAAIKSRVKSDPGFDVHWRGELVYAASFRADDRERVRDDLVWEEPIYLPSTRSLRKNQRDVFFARISGDSEVIPFDPAVDRFSIGDQHDAPQIQRLRESGFEPRQWRIRAASTHSRSGTGREGVE